MHYCVVTNATTHWDFFAWSWDFEIDFGYENLCIAISGFVLRFHSAA